MNDRQIDRALARARKAHRQGAPNPEAHLLDPDELGSLRSAALAARLNRAEIREEKAARDEAAYQARKAAGETVLPKARTGGPRTAEGKAISSLNNLQHGLTGSFRILHNERQEDFDSVVLAFEHEHQPATTTEHTLIEKMAEHLWLSRRSQRLQDFALEEDDMPRLNVYLRYQSTNERAFYKAFHELARLQKDRVRSAKTAQREFVSQKREQQLAESHAARVRLANARAAHLESQTKRREALNTPTPNGFAPPLQEGNELVTRRLTEKYKDTMAPKAA